jgi:hypothetical protein
MNLKPEIKKLWVDALRSEEYTQGMYQLKVEGLDGVTRHCCLGVLSELCVKETGISTLPLLTLKFPPQEVWEWAGTPDIALNTRVLSALNDSGKKFHEIADHIESSEIL